MVSLQDRIVAVLADPDCICIWPRRRALDRLWLDDGAIPSHGLRLLWAIWQLKRRRIVQVKDGYVGLSEIRAIIAGCK